MNIDVKHKIGDVVFLKTDLEQKPRMVYGYVVYATSMLYKLTQSDITSEHYDFEISEEMNMLYKLDMAKPYEN